MKEKFLIAKAAAHGYWNYDQGFKFRYGEDSNVWRFINGSINTAIQYSSYEAAAEIITYLGVGIFKIEKIYVNETF